VAQQAVSSSPTTSLNQFKDREMFRIDLRHITGRIDLLQFSHELTDLAEVVVEEGCRLCHEALEQQFGAPRLENGQLCRWCVCGLGKFGGRELGFASDIELLLVYEGAGHPQARSASEGYPPGDSHSISNARYFDELVTQFLQTLVTRREGIFEIDLRLRPHGKAGSLACSLDGFRGYFSAAGGAQQFERLALVKLRPVAGDRTLGEKVVMARNDFVYSAQPLDYQNILHLRQRQAKELVAPRTASAKHSQGGLVDIEYFVQAKQIEIGRDDASVRVTGTLEAIDRLAAAGALTAEQAVQLSQSYRFLRQLIEALRVVRGHSKDLTIPAPSQREFDHLARRMRYDSPAALAREIDDHMAFAHALWAGVN
jgi:glutamate-ammonia-ligase adenylyltransferase